MRDDERVSRAGGLVARLGRLADWVAGLAVLAAILGVVAPSPGLARRSDVLLAILVALTALGIAPQRLGAACARWRVVVAMSIGPLLALTGAAWLLGRAFAEPTREGLLALGASSSEVASVGLVALAGGDAALALGVVTGSLVAAALLGPPLVSALGHAATHAHGGHLVGRFALVVIAPLIIGLVLRRARPTLAHAEPALASGSALVVCLLVYAALSGVGHGEGLDAAVLASVAFLLVASAVAALAVRLARGADARAVGLSCALRDFAVAAALATQAFGPRAATVAGVYGVLMLVAGAVAASLLGRQAHRNIP